MLSPDCISSKKMPLKDKDLPKIRCLTNSKMMVDFNTNLMLMAIIRPARSNNSLEGKVANGKLVDSTIQLNR